MISLEEAPVATLSRLDSEVSAGGFHEAHIGHAVVARNLKRAIPFLGCVGGERTSENGRIVAHDHAFGACDDPDPDDHSATNGVIGLVRGYWTDLEERAVGIDYVGDPLAYGEFLTGPQPCHAGSGPPPASA